MKGTTMTSINRNADGTYRSATKEAAAKAPRKPLISAEAKANGKKRTVAVGKGVGGFLAGVAVVAAAIGEAAVENERTEREFDNRQKRLSYLSKEQIANSYGISDWGRLFFKAELPQWDMFDDQPYWHVDTIRAWAEENRFWITDATRSL